MAKRGLQFVWWGWPWRFWFYRLPAWQGLSTIYDWTIHCGPWEIRHWVPDPAVALAANREARGRKDEEYPLA